MKPFEARPIILAAVERARADGWDICGGMWAFTREDGKKFCCPMSALVGPMEVACAKFPGNYALAGAALKLDISTSFVDRFVLGFDFGVRDENLEDDQWVLLGQELREELL